MFFLFGLPVVSRITDSKVIIVNKQKKKTTKVNKKNVVLTFFCSSMSGSALGLVFFGVRFQRCPAFVLRYCSVFCYEPLTGAMPGVAL